MSPSQGFDLFAEKIDGLEAFRREFGTAAAVDGEHHGFGGKTGVGDLFGVGFRGILVGAVGHEHGVRSPPTNIRRANALQPIERTVVVLGAFEVDQAFGNGGFKVVGRRSHGGGAEERFRRGGRGLRGGGALIQKAQRVLRRIGRQKSRNDAQENRHCSRPDFHSTPFLKKKPRRIARRLLVVPVMHRFFVENALGQLGERLGGVVDRIKILGIELEFVNELPGGCRHLLRRLYHRQQVIGLCSGQAARNGKLQGGILRRGTVSRVVVVGIAVVVGRIDERVGDDFVFIGTLGHDLGKRFGDHSLGPATSPAFSRSFLVSTCCPSAARSAIATCCTAAISGFRAAMVW